MPANMNKSEQVDLRKEINEKLRDLSNNREDQMIIVSGDFNSILKDYNNRKMNKFDKKLKKTIEENNYTILNNLNKKTFQRGECISVIDHTIVNNQYLGSFSEVKEIEIVNNSDHVGQILEIELDSENNLNQNRNHKTMEKILKSFDSIRTISQLQGDFMTINSKCKKKK